MWVRMYYSRRSRDAYARKRERERNRSARNCAGCGEGGEARHPTPNVIKAFGRKSLRAGETGGWHLRTRRGTSFSLRRPRSIMYRYTKLGPHTRHDFDRDPTSLEAYLVSCVKARWRVSATATGGGHSGFFRGAKVSCSSVLFTGERWALIVVFLRISCSLLQWTYRWMVLLVHVGMGLGWGGSFFEERLTLWVCQCYLSVIQKNSIIF